MNAPARIPLPNTVLLNSPSQPSRRLLLGALGFSALLAACGGGGSGDAVPVVPAVAPTLTITSSAGELAGSVFTVRVEFSAPVATFPSGSLPFALQARLPPPIAAAQRAFGRVEARGRSSRPASQCAGAICVASYRG